MINNDVLRSLRYILSANESKLISIFGQVDFVIEPVALRSYVLKESEEGFVACPDEVMANFLNGLVLFKRGKNEDHPVPEVELPLNNNTVLKKLRVAFELKDSDMNDIFAAADFRVSKPELSALFRKAGSKNFRPCGDQMLRYFLKGLAHRERGSNE